MRLLRVQEFSLNTNVEYSRPVAFQEARLDDEAAKALLESECAPYINPIEISLTKQNEFYGYTLSVPMFNGAASILINALGVTLAFRQGGTAANLALIIKLTLSALQAIKRQEFKHSSITFNAHAFFAVSSDFEEHMKRFVALGNNVVSGGNILEVDIPELDGKIRYATEKSLAYEHALFFAVNAVCVKDVSIDMFKILESIL